MTSFLPGLMWLSIACASVTLSGCGSDSGANNESTLGSGASPNGSTGGTRARGTGGSGGVSSGSANTGGSGTSTTGGSSTGASGGAGTGGSKMTASVKEGWYCGQVSEACACIPTTPGLPATNSCTLPLAGCCFTFVLDGSAGCHCEPTTARFSCVQWLAVAQGTQVTACPPP